MGRGFEVRAVNSGDARTPFKHLLKGNCSESIHGNLRLPPALVHNNHTLKANQMLNFEVRVRGLYRVKGFGVCRLDFGPSSRASANMSDDLNKTHVSVPEAGGL